MESRKRSRDEFETSNGVLIDNVASSTLKDQPADSNAPTESEQEWQTVGKRRKKIPKKGGDHYPSVSHSPHARLQSWVKVTDLQGLVLYTLADGNAPQWCSVAHRGNFRKAVMLMIPGLDAGMFDGSTQMALSGPPEGATTQPKNESTMPALNFSPDAYYPVKLSPDNLSTPVQPFCEVFEHLWPIKTPGDDKYARMHSPLASVLLSPVQKAKEQRQANGQGPVAAVEARNWKNKRVPITEYLATTDELLLEGFVLHPAHFASDSTAGEAYQQTRRINKTGLEDGWADTHNVWSLADGATRESDIEQGSITTGRRVLAIDCEMCITSAEDVKPPVYSLTRMSVVDWDGNVVLDELVQPAQPITNYLTAYSGITPAMLEGVTTTLKDAQEKLLAQITPHTILVGHSLNSDLNALQIAHPFIVDTALLYPHPRGPPLKSSLKWLAQKYLSRKIQEGHGSTGHNSVEDAIASLDLVKQKCEKGKAWGTSEASNESIFLRLSRSNRPKRDKIRPNGDDEPRSGAVVDWGDPKRGFGAAAKVSIGCKTDGDVVAGIKRAVLGDADSAVVQIMGVDLVWARFRELEAYRGWWRSSKTADADALREAAKARAADQSLAEVVSTVAKHVQEIWHALPPCTAFIVYSGSGDPRRLSELQEMQRQFKTEYATKKWDQLTIKWTDIEEQELRRACEQARRGIGFIAVK